MRTDNDLIHVDRIEEGYHSAMKTEENYSPFARSPRGIEPITEADADMLSGEPAPLVVLTEVTIEEPTTTN